MRHLKLVCKQQAAPLQNEWGFNSRDLIALTCWMQQSDAHGYRRVLIEGGSGQGGPEEGGYVLIYAPTRDWASWGIARSGDDIALWNCGSGADLGRFPSMLQALESLPTVCTQAKARRPAMPLLERSQLEQHAAEPLRPFPRLYISNPS